ncbi:hypothetical protein N5A93_14940 [Roseovarius sp. EGI FJ00037]|uniref:hypothetical protein n=1 Tax=Roseovarius salincola TaxID=2978479 RepID=UPI0022A82A0C|nr:hypothetical protein [Roseovarius sp. EGI FJ00037]MCZ0813532.1 hypothetical protein [Roseovarius sp. EGI FJ00037]
MTDHTTPQASVSPFVAEDTPMLSDVIAQVDGLPDLKQTRQRDFKSALTTIARLLGKAPDRVPANINWLHVRLRRVAPAAYNMSNKRFQNIKSDAIKALALTGCSRDRADWLRPPCPAWRALLDRVADKHDLWKLTQLAQYCTALGVSPDAISDDHINGMLEALIAESFQNNPEHKAADAIKVWNRLRKEVDGWPDIELNRLPRKKEPWTIPLEQFPQSLQDDVATWINRLANPDLLDEDAPAKPLRPTTIKHRQFQLREAASALVRSGMPIAQIDGLAVLVDLDNMKRALRWMMGRFDNKPTEAIKGVAVCLQAVARHQVRLKESEIKSIAALIKRLGQDVDGLREKNRQRLLQLDDPSNLAKLLNLPAALVKTAQKLESAKPRKAALKLQAALAIEILLNAPLRAGNLSNLHLERHLRPIGSGRTRQVHIHIPADEVKNDKALDYLLPTNVAVMLDLYMQKARPILEGQPSDYLFPAQNGGAKRPAHLSRLIKDTILEHTGLIINAHLFRSIAGKIHSLVQPGDYVTLSHVLNNSLPMAMKAYAQFERQSSLQHYQNSLEAARRGGGV